MKGRGATSCLLWMASLCALFTVGGRGKASGPRISPRRDSMKEVDLLPSVPSGMPVI